MGRLKAGEGNDRYVRVGHGPRAAPGRGACPAGTFVPPPAASGKKQGAAGGAPKRGARGPFSRRGPGGSQKRALGASEGGPGGRAMIVSGSSTRHGNGS